jgi:serine/threonine-protein kinase
MTETGSIMGTAQYLSPEQAQGHAVSAGSDLYAIGVVLYELLTGRVPFDADSAVSIALKHVSEPPVAPRAINPAIPRELEQIVLWTLSKNPAQRPRDADQLIDALERVRERIASGTHGQRTAVVPIVPVLEHRPTVAEAVPVQRRRPVWPWLLALLVLLLAAGGVAAYLLTRPVLEVVPPVTNEPLNTARTQLQNAGFSVGVLNVTGNAPAGIVIGQDPAGGTKADKHSTVTLTVSQGPGDTTVPPVAGLRLPAAEKALRQAHLRVGRIALRSSDQVPQNVVIGTDPASGQNPAVDTRVTLFVSSGKPKVAVPNVTGQPRAAAQRALAKAHLQASVTRQESTTVRPGTVISQDPGAGTLVLSGSTVALVVARAPATARVPDVRGDPASIARTILTTAGFKVVKVTRIVTRRSRGGLVLAQTPAAGSTVKKGSTVTIVVGRFRASPPPPTTTTTTPTTTTTTPTTTTTTTTPTTTTAP